MDRQRHHFIFGLLLAWKKSSGQGVRETDLQVRELEAEKGKRIEAGNQEKQEASGKVHDFLDSCLEEN